MKKIALKYGTISGLIAGALILTTTLIEKQYGIGSTPSIFGIIGLILAFIPVFLGVKEFRETEGGGTLTFLKGLNVGIIIVAISGVFYAIFALTTFYSLTPDFPDKVCAYQIKQKILSGKDLKDTVLIKQGMADYKNMTKNPFLFGALSFTDTLPLGVILSLACAGILRKKPPTLELDKLS